MFVFDKLIETSTRLKSLVLIGFSDTLNHLGEIGRYFAASKMYTTHQVYSKLNTWMCINQMQFLLLMVTT